MIGTAGEARQIEGKVLSTAWLAGHVFYRLDKLFSVAVKEMLRDGLKASDLLLLVDIELRKRGCKLRVFAIVLNAEGE